MELPLVPSFAPRGTPIVTLEALHFLVDKRNHEDMAML